jgi:uncharacterized phage-associated protein
MLIDPSREKLLNAMIFFSKNTQNVFKMKMFKLLFYLDFMHFKETGRAVTNLSYFAWPMGPVPKKLFEELDAPLPDFKASISLTKGNIDADFGTQSLRFLAKKPFDESVFTERELSKMRLLAEVFNQATATMMSEATHLRGQPWDRVRNKEKRPLAEIPYSFALDSTADSITKEQLNQIEEEQTEMKELQAFFD